MKKQDVVNGNEYLVFFFKDAARDGPIRIPKIYNLVGSGLLPLKEMTRIAAKSPEEIAGEVGLSFHKTAGFRFLFAEPKSFSEATKIVKDAEQEFLQDGWQIERSLAAEPDNEDQDPSVRKALGFLLIISKPDQQPKFSNAERRELKLRARKIAAQI